MRTQTQHPRHFIMVIALTLLTLLGSLPGLSSIQAIDRDEARYAQSSQQMFESQDYVNIRFHDRDRHKKPAGIYWAQTAMLKLFSNPARRDIWVHRLPSVLAGLIAVLGLYWAGLSLYDRQTAFIGAALLSSCLLFVFESHIAKTDAALCACSVWVMGAGLRLRINELSHQHKRYATILWAALGASVIIKGPILPAILITALISTAIWERRAGLSLEWIKRFISPLGICLFGLIALPWFIMIGKETGGGFYGTAIGSDLAPKLAGGQEKHGGYPGYYTLTIFILFWPAALFLLTALSYGMRAARRTLTGGISSQNARWLLCWGIPFWIILEVIPTKLPHYLLPLYPAIALLMAGAISSIHKYEFFKTTRIIGASLFFAATIILIFITSGAEALYGADRFWVYGLGVLIALTALATSLYAAGGQIKLALIGLFITGFSLSTSAYGFILPGLKDTQLAPRISAQMRAKNISLPRDGGALIRSPHFTEPSLIYYLGTNILLGEKADDFKQYPHILGQIWIIDMKRSDAQERLNSLTKIADYNQTCLRNITHVKGMNYSKGDEVDLAVLSITDCQ